MPERMTSRRAMLFFEIGLTFLGVVFFVEAAAGKGPDNKEVLGPNLVVNGSFESGEQLPGWHWGVANGAKAKMTLDHRVAHTGKCSVCLSSRSPLHPNVYGGLSQEVRGVRPRCEYLIRLWAKGEGVGHCWFGGGPGWHLRKYFPTGDFGWRPFEIRWKAPVRIASFSLRINVDSVTTALWVDDVSFQEINPITVRPRVSLFSFSEAPRFGFLPATKLTHSPKIDGDLKDWPADAISFSLPSQCGTVKISGWKGEKDLSAQLRTGWTREAFYIGLTVTDDIHWAPEGERMWTNDSVQVAFDPKLDRTPMGYAPDDSEYSFALTNRGNVRVDCWHASQILGDQSKAIQLDVKRSGDHTVYEAAIPWRAIGVPTQKGALSFGFSFLINDNDGAGRRGYLELTPGIGRVKDPSQYVSVIGLSARALALICQSDVIYTDEPIIVTAAFFEGHLIAPSTEIDFTWKDTSGREHPVHRVPLPPGKKGLVVVEAGFEPGLIPTGRHSIVARVVRQGKELVRASRTVEVSNLKEEIQKEAEQLRARLDQIEKIERQAEKKKIATDYERVVIATARDFIGFAIDDVRHRRGLRARHVLDVVRTQLSKVEKRLKDYVAGRARPFLVPRYRVGKVEVKDGAFWADTIVPTTGEKERRPVFFTGYGHFGRVVADMPKFPDLGVNIIQIEIGPNSTEPEEGVVTGAPVRGKIGRALELGEKYNVMVCWLASPHYFPRWALKKWPDLQKGGGGFFHFTVDAPQAHKILKTHLETSLNAIKNYPTLHSVCLSNEPVYTNWTNDPFRRPLWHEYLKRVYKTIDNLNRANGTKYKTFTEVPVPPTSRLPREEEMTPLVYDMVRFNMNQFAAFHRFMTGVVHRVRPGTWTHAKVMCVPTSRQHLTWGCDPEEFAYAGDLNGNDCSMMFTSFGDHYAASWLGQAVYYDLQYSMRHVPIFNTENHIIRDREQRLIPPEHTDCALWQGAIHGQGATTIWVWERTYNRRSDFEGSILHRPENVIAVGHCGLDLMRLAPEVNALQNAARPVAILYSLTSQIWSDRAHEAMLKAYEALDQTGLPVAFVSERQACRGGLDQYRVVILPEVTYASNELYRAIQNYAKHGGKLWVLGSDMFAKDEHGKARKVVDVPKRAITRWPSNIEPRDLRDRMLRAMADAGVSRPVVLREKNGKEPWGIEYRSVNYKGGYLVSVVNYWGQPQTVRLFVGDRPGREIVDLRSGRKFSANNIELQPLKSLLLQVQ